MENGIENAKIIADKLSASGYIVDLLDFMRSETIFQKKHGIDLGMFRDLSKDLKILAVSASDISLEEGELEVLLVNQLMTS